MKRSSVHGASGNVSGREKLLNFLPWYMNSKRDRFLEITRRVNVIEGGKVFRGFGNLIKTHRDIKHDTIFHLHISAEPFSKVSGFN